ncbi:TPA: N-6 DNA methylase [Pseudomonas aeruginosa]|uniref:Eco57I restriction-modification methylase domain-containing protein n=1 Tax=Pseudomonas aeruginosa TaxID=287 RepID=UPI0021E12304|nr:DNA methyltransferase [Pseudomonas aeruginosa]MCV0141381.1 N-6 DNA methylase [Pseudomonas aeruginosa]MCV0343075.1 N-6 DNA methylase [Pseudomonas aeruginosa]MDY1021854.1 DNA methyltransferase [Pseudomonas aeruginosa]HBO3944110.1 N-6 DNA methylase [Pseudomonas aeruginosa]HCF5871881.1 N-6 DNA methylase [Pseudomonas aeruginosa]
MTRTIHREFDSLRIEGGIFPGEFLNAVRDLKLKGQGSTDYGLHRTLKLRDEVSRYWRIARAEWEAFNEARQRQDIDRNALSVERFLVPLLQQVFGFSDLQACRQPRYLGERHFPLSHEAGFAELAAISSFSLGAGADEAPRRIAHIPLVLTGPDFILDKSYPAFGDEGRRRSPQGLLQEYLNASSEALWGIVSNGLVLRILRDNPSMTRPAFVEVDLARLFEDDLYPDFVALWLTLHASRFLAQNGKVGQCWLEQWREQAVEEGERARSDLRAGVEQALRALGTGFVAHPANRSLRDRLSSGELSPQAYFQQLLRLVYRLLFLLTAEDRNILHDPATATPEARRLYGQGYSMSLLRDRARKRRFYDDYADLWQALTTTFASLASGQPLLGLPALGGLFAKDQCVDLDSGQLDNKALLAAVRAVSWVQRKNGAARINYRDMDTEELGSVYESLLELIPRINPAASPWQFGFIGDAEGESDQGNARKTSGSYYTPDNLVQELIQSALLPVIEQRLKANPEQPRAALLSIKVCDPACGSGHFLLAAARRLAAKVAELDAQGDQYGEEQYRHALREVVLHCIHGVDLNPMAIELCKTALWLEALEPGKPLGFLDAHIQCGNALLGINDLKALENGIPKDAFKALSGDDKDVCKQLTKENKEGLKALEKAFDRQQTISLSLESAVGYNELQALDALPDDTLSDIAAKDAAYRAYQQQAQGSRLLHAANLLVGAFLLEKTESSQVSIPTSKTLYLELFSESRSVQHEQQLNAAMTACEEARVLHWPLVFPQVFRAGGFDCVLGNPPWERIKLQEEEFFASRSQMVASAGNKAERSQRIDWLSQGLLAQNLYPGQVSSFETREAEQRLYREFIVARRTAEAASVFAHVNGEDGGRFPLTGVGDVNTYALFSETIRQVISPMGRAGFIVPSGLATDNTTKAFFGDLIEQRSLESFFEFENEGYFKGAGQGHMLRFALTTVLGSQQQASATRFLFQGKQLDELQDPERVFTLTAEEIFQVNPNTRTCPIFRSRMDADITRRVYARVPVLVREAAAGKEEQNPWGVRFMAMFHMANDSYLFKTKSDLLGQGFSRCGNIFVGGGGRYLPLYEAKMVTIYNHRHGDFDDALDGKRAHILPTVPESRLRSTEYLACPYYWVSEEEVESNLNDKGWSSDWLIGWREITDARASARTVVAAVVPRRASNNTFVHILPGICGEKLAALLANMCSIVFDYIARQKVGGLHLNFYMMRQLPVLPPATYSRNDLDFILPRVLELTYTACDLEGWARELGYIGSPFVFDAERRAVIRAELDAYYARLYGLSEKDLKFILDPESVAPGYPSETFSVLQRNEIREFGEYRTKKLVLEAWDKLEQGELI